MSRRNALVKHVFVPSGRRSYGERICVCGSLERHSVHKLPERSDEEREIEERRVGERG